MFENPGKKLKSFASILFCISAIGCVIGGVSVINSGSTRYGNPLVGIGLVLIVGGVIVSYVMSLFIYGFGELISNSAKSDAEKEKEIQENIRKRAEAEAKLLQVEQELLDAMNDPNIDKDTLNEKCNAVWRLLDGNNLTEEDRKRIDRELDECSYKLVSMR